MTSKGLRKHYTFPENTLSGEPRALCALLMRNAGAYGEARALRENGALELTNFQSVT